MVLSQNNKAINFRLDVSTHSRLVKCERSHAVLPKGQAPQVYENYRRLLAGEELLNRVDHLKGY
jgi:hypothetical protein